MDSFTANLKKTIKHISRTHGLNYEEVKQTSKKQLKECKAMMDDLREKIRDLIDLSSASSFEDVLGADLEIVKMFCGLYEVETDGTEEGTCRALWEYLADEYGYDESGSEDYSEESEDESEEDSSEDEPERPSKPPSPKKEPEIKSSLKKDDGSGKKDGKKKK